MLTRWLALGACLLAGSVIAGGQTVIEDYEEARDAYFWPLLYDIGGTTLYCERRFEAGARETVEGWPVWAEHAYPAQWIALANGCPDRDHCDTDAYRHAESDLHNLWPAIRAANISRSDNAFGILPGEDSRRLRNKCADFERSSGADAVVEPRDEVKGDLARSLLYMADAYDLPLRGMEVMLLRWHLADPPDAMERWRAYAIERIQGTRNPYVLGGE